LECNHECINECFKCQEYSAPHEFGNKGKMKQVKIERIKHGKCRNVCNKLLFCGHACKDYCHEGNVCPPCKKNCSVSCEHTSHTSCGKSCLEPCTLCAEKCLWRCEHQGRCELSCGVPCYRLPCNEKCNKKLECGHVCAGVCGEICPSKDFCIICAPKNVKSQGITSY